MITFYYTPWTRASSVFWLLEELGQPYRIELVDIRGAGGAPESYRAIQPNKKVPAIDDGGTVVTERAAITIYLADRYPQAGLAPRQEDGDRAAYLTWLVYADSVLDPALAARAHGLEYTSNDYSFGLFEDMQANLERTLARRPYIAGDRFTAADVQVGASLRYAIDILKLLPAKAVFSDYLERVENRPAHRSYADKEMAFIEKLRQAG